MREVVVTGIGLVTPLGIGTEINWKRLISGKIGIDKITDFDVSDLPCKIAGQIPLKENDNEAGLNFNDWIDQTAIKSPFAKIEDSGIYGLEPSVRSAVNRVFTNKTFFRELSLLNRLKRRSNEASRFLGRHPFVFGLMVAATTYFVIPEQETQKTISPPPSFPH